MKRQKLDTIRSGGEHHSKFARNRAYCYSIRTAWRRYEAVGGYIHIPWEEGHRLNRGYGEKRSEDRSEQWWFVSRRWGCGLWYIIIGDIRGIYYVLGEGGVKVPRLGFQHVLGCWVRFLLAAGARVAGVYLGGGVRRVVYKWGGRGIDVYVYLHVGVCENTRSCMC